MKEYTSMQLAVPHFPPDVRDDTWIIKISGRYLIIDDTFFNTVQSAPDTCNVIGRTFGEEDNYVQFYTFYYERFSKIPSITNPSVKRTQ
jgi:hypothetical protein